MAGSFLRRVLFRAGVLGHERRREPREELGEATVEIAGQAYPVKDWSSSGFRAAPCSAAHKPGDRVDIRFSALLPEGKIEFASQAIVVWADARKQELAGVFVMMEPEARVAVARHFE